MNTNHSSFEPLFGNFPYEGRLSLLIAILMPIIPPSMRQPLFLFSRLYECMECMRHKPESFFRSCENTSETGHTSEDILNRIRPFLSPKEQDQFSQIQSMLQMLQLMQTLSNLTPETGQPQDSAFSSPFAAQTPDALFSMLSPEQQAMFESLSSIMSDTKTETATTDT